MTAITQTPATLGDLRQTSGKGELVNGRIVPIMPTGRRPNRIAGRIYRRLDDYAETQGVGEAYTDNVGFTVSLLPSGRESFSPNASYFVGPFPADPMRLLEGSPTFAVEVRSENDCEPAALQELAAKRADYFAAGTLVVWDVDPVNEVIGCYRHTDPTQPVRFVRGQIAEAEPTVPGWTVAVADVFA